MSVRQNASVLSGRWQNVQMSKYTSTIIILINPRPAGTVEEIRPAGSTVTILTHIFKQRDIHPTPDEATMMLLGLYEDTSKLLSHATAAADYEAAAYLVEHGGNLNTVSDFLVQELTSDQVALLHKLLLSLTAINVIASISTSRMLPSTILSGISRC